MDNVIIKNVNGGLGTPVTPTIPGFPLAAIALALMILSYFYSQFDGVNQQ